MAQSPENKPTHPSSSVEIGLPPSSLTLKNLGKRVRELTANAEVDEVDDEDDYDATYPLPDGRQVDLLAHIDKASGDINSYGIVLREFNHERELHSWKQYEVTRLFADAPEVSKDMGLGEINESTFGTAEDQANLRGGGFETIELEKEIKPFEKKIAETTEKEMADLIDLLAPLKATRDQE